MTKAEWKIHHRAMRTLRTLHRSFNHVEHEVLKRLPGEVDAKYHFFWARENLIKDYFIEYDHKAPFDFLSRKADIAPKKWNWRLVDYWKPVPLPGTSTYMVKKIKQLEKKLFGGNN